MMPRVRDPAHRALPFAEWGEADRARWLEALRPRQPEDEERSTAAAWRPTTAKNNRHGYGRWLAYCLRSGCPDPASPSDRATQSRVRDYLQELRSQGLALSTQRGRVSELLAVMLAIAPGRDWTWLKEVVNRLDARARESKTRQPPPLLSGDLLDKSLAALTALETGGGELDLDGAREYRDWLMVAMLSIMPLRLRNFANLSLERHLNLECEDWCVEIGGAETKTGQPISMPVPAMLHRAIRHYLQQIRPCLLAGRTSDRLWISRRHGPLKPHGLYTELKAFTRRMFGVGINPHLFRHIAATSTVVTSPDQLDAARALLAHATAETTSEYYVLGRSLAASRKQAALVQELRGRLTGRTATDMVEKP